MTCSEDSVANSSVGLGFLFLCFVFRGGSQGFCGVVLFVFWGCFLLLFGFGFVCGFFLK